MMEGMKRLTAEEERRLKLLEYLAAKGKLKPENNCKSYLKDCTNVQSKKQQESSKQICETKKHAYTKGSNFAFEANKNKASNTGSNPHKPSLGKISAQQTVSTNRLVNKTLSRNPLPSKGALSKVRSDHAGKTLQPSAPDTHAKKQERSEGSDVALTVILTKTQGEKPEVCVMDKTSSSKSGQHVPGLRSGMQPKNREQSISRSKQTVVTKTITQSTKTSVHISKTQPASGKPMSVASSGHIRIVSRLSLPGDKSNTTNERSFLIKTSRNDSSKKPVNVRKDQLEGKFQEATCPTKQSLAASGVSSTSMAHKKMSTGLVSAPKIRPHSSDYTSKNMSSSQNSLNKPIAPRKSTGPTVGNKVVDRSKDKYNIQSRVRENKQQGVTGATKEATTKPSNLMAKNATCRPQTPKMTVEDRKKKLQEWLNSKGKTYKRPPMVLPPKRPPTAKKQNPCNRSLWEGIEEEEELLSLSKKISQTLSECLGLIEKGIPSEDIHAALDKVPEGKKFAKYWVCKAKLLEREGVYDVVDLYKQGVQFGATPIDELREVVFDIMKNTNKKTKVVTFGPLPAEEEVENDDAQDMPITPFINPTEELKTPCTGTGICDQGSAVKLQITSLSSKKIPGSGQEWKRLTPVRRSVRIHHSASQYPEVVQEHDTVVSSLQELLDQADTDAYLYMRNEALPEEVDHGVVSLIKKDLTEDQHEGPE